MLPDFDNAQKWLSWLKARWFYRIWVISPIVLLVIIGVLSSQYTRLKNDLDKTKNELVPIKQLYPKLELSAAVGKLIEDHKILKNEIDIAKQKEMRKHFVPLSQNGVTRFKEEAMKLADSHSNIDFEIQVLSDSPTNDLFRKATELVNLFEGTSIEAKYANTIFSSEHNVVVRYSEALPRDVVNEINMLLKIVFKNTLHFEYLNMTAL